MSILIVSLFFWVIASPAETVPSCLPDFLKKSPLGISFGSFSEHVPVNAMEGAYFRKDKIYHLDYFPSDLPGVFQISFGFFLPEGMLANVVPSDALLKYIEVQYDASEDVKAEMMDNLGAPAELTVPDAGIVYPHDAKWLCPAKGGDTVFITLKHKRLRFE